jgi:chitin disaccharide deacetylase
MEATRFLIVLADDYGIGPETSRGILELAAKGVVTGTVLMVNSPYALEAVRAWRQSGMVPELGWHPCLTMDPPAAGGERVPSLVGPDGCMWPLGRFLKRLMTGRVLAEDIERELNAQYERFIDWVGRPPMLINVHQHVGLFPPIGALLRQVLERSRPRPYVRRIVEPVTMLARIRGARVKRAALTLLGRRQARDLRRAGFPGADCLVGVTDPKWVRDPEFFVRLLSQAPSLAVELGCHPGHLDLTLPGRDGDGFQRRRVDEYRLLADPSFDEACRRARFTRVAPSEWIAARNLWHSRRRSA